MSAIKAFTSDAFDADDQDYTHDSDWGDWDNRRLRYDMQWAFYTSNIYNETIKNYTLGYKSKEGLYKFIRPLYNPAYRLGEFYASKVWGGRLDIIQGDNGQEIAGDSGALPIITDNERLREVIATLWRDSNWKTKRNLTTRRGAVLGDTFIEAVNDTEREKVYLRSIHPAKVKSLDVDPFGNVKGYVLEYKRTDDVNLSGEVTYTEKVFKDGNDVVYQLFKNGSPYHWGNESAEWSLPYGFVPMVAIQHRDMGIDWGFSEAFPKLPLFQEIDDQGSKLNDQIRKVVDAQYAVLGASKPTSTPVTTNTPKSATQRQAGRDESRFIYVPAHGDKQPTIEPLVANLDISSAIDNIKMMTEQIELEYPELALMKMQVSGKELSGRALRLLQAEPKNKVVNVRDVYDDALVRIQQMAIAMGGDGGYSGYEGFGLNSYENGDLNHSIGDRDVFSRDVLDDLEIAKLQGEVYVPINTASGADAAVELTPHLTQEQRDALTGGATVASTVGL